MNHEQLQASERLRLPGPVTQRWEYDSMYCFKKINGIRPGPRVAWWISGRS